MSTPPQQSCGDRCRFAPTTSGPAHPGTLLAALLCWLDARSSSAWLGLRLEDVDPTRCTAHNAREMCDALEWLGLEWDAVEHQSESRAAHDAALQQLARAGHVYACGCSRSAIRQANLPAVDGGWRYPGTCRDRVLREAEVLRCSDAVRLRLEPGRVDLRDESGLELSQDPSQALGDPILRRADGAIAYHLAAVVDDARAGVTRVVRGRDLAGSSALQVSMQRRLALPTPVYRHHLLLQEPRGGKLAKLHGSVGWRELERYYTPEGLCGVLARLAGLRPRPESVTPAELLADFDWERVRATDQVVRWSEGQLIPVGA